MCICFDKTNITYFLIKCLVVVEIFFLLCYGECMWIMVIVGVVIFLGLMLYMFSLGQKFNILLDEMKKKRNGGKFSAADAINVLKKKYGVNDVAVKYQPGGDRDFYNSKYKLIVLGEENFFSDSLASLAVACHELGHAVQHARNNKFWKRRELFKNLYILATVLAVPLFFLGTIMVVMEGFIPLAVWSFVGSIALLLSMVLFRFFNIPCEGNASDIAVEMMIENDLCSESDLVDVKKLFKYAKETYIKGFLSFRL